MYADPTYEAMDAISQLGLPVVEIGSGDGEWQRAMIRAGIECVGCDISDGPDHKDAARNYPNHVMLAVWPPDGDEVQDWINAADWPAVILVHGQRINVGNTLGGRKLSGKIRLPIFGPKQSYSLIEIWQ